MSLRTLRMLLIFGAAFLAVFLGFRFGGDLFGVHGPSAEAIVENSPSLASPGSILPGTVKGSESESSNGTFRRVGSSVAPAFTAHAAMIADPLTGEVLFNFNPGMRWPVASLTKLVTAEVIKDKMDLSKTFTLAEPDFAVGGTSLTRELAPGDSYRGQDLFKIMLVSSSNEAAEAFARVYGRSTFLAAMNASAAEWGLRDTHFSDPSGIAASDQASAEDMKTVAMRVWALHPEVFATTRLDSIRVVEQNSGLMKSFENTNQFAGRLDFLGGKTGTTPEAGENLLSFFSYRGHPVMILLMGSEDRYVETEKLLTWFTHDFSAGN